MEELNKIKKIVIFPIKFPTSLNKDIRKKK